MPIVALQRLLDVGRMMTSGSLEFIPRLAVSRGRPGDARSARGELPDAD